jgi:hypothetical protein
MQGAFVVRLGVGGSEDCAELSGRVEEVDTSVVAEREKETTKMKELDTLKHVAASAFVAGAATPAA